MDTKEVIELSSELEKLTPMMQQYLEIKEQYQDFILFYRLGDFYEMFFEDAIKASRALGIALTKRACGSGKKAPLCGVPFHAADTYLSRLVASGFKVAICEQMEDPKLAKGIVKREVTRLITPGTLSDPDMMEAKSNSFLASLSYDEEHLALAYVDISTGLFRLRTYGRDEFETLLDALYMLEVKEVLIDTKADFFDLIKDFAEGAGFEMTITEKLKSSSSHRMNLEKVLSYLNISSLQAFGLDEDSYTAVEAIASLLDYMDLTLKHRLPYINSIILETEKGSMKLDSFSVKNLELFGSLRNEGREGSLLSVMDRTKTAMGSRLLKRRLLQPLTDKYEIDARLEALSYFFEQPLLRSDIRALLSGIYDFERLLTKLALSSINPRDMIAFRSSFALLPEIKRLLPFGDSTYATRSHSALNRIALDFDCLDDLYTAIEEQMTEEAPLSIRAGSYTKQGYSEELDELNFIINNSEKILAEIEEEERERTGIKNLKLGYNKVYGYYVEISKGQISKVPEDYIRRQTLTGGERYILPKLKELENQILGAKDRALQLEIQFFEELRLRLLENASRIRKMGEMIAEIDVYAALAELAHKYDYVRPEIEEHKLIRLEAARHPVVESIVKRGEFIENDCELGSSTKISMIITGPNMAGKSTYLRQVALITLMAQMGSYVPCKYAHIGLVDRIFTRVGASDDLYRGRSTFMVEMLELANILNNATDRSLIILDEIGRGTATFDGLSIAWSALEHIVKNIKARSLFATHYHELTEMEEVLEGVENYRISALERGDRVIFLRKLERGSADKSYGIEVAGLAGLPRSVILRAREILKLLESSDIARSNLKNVELSSCENSSVEERPPYEDMLGIIDSIDLYRTSPVEVQSKLDLLKNKLKEYTL